ncbi:MAG: pyruvate dehydrogenase (acetyl-transferring), homodimeric type [Myxococcota bacterium]|jgi:pyruvate dehydrogenase E1 component|nr:pyruvate dehydrogenase (acetyl-transferring), homodimeric type [Myxococcota bacterium]
MTQEHDVDPEETRDWLDSLHSVLEKEGLERAHYLIERLVAEMRRSGAHLPYTATTAYLNTIRKSDEERSPGEQGLEHRIRSINRWNALAMVYRANVKSSELGGHISSYASSATLYEVAFNHFFHSRTEDHGGDLVFFQGHCAPGIYARAFLEGRISEEQLMAFRQEAFDDGLSSYPHPWLMRDFWSFPTVSMGLASLMAIYQARFMKHLHQRGVIDASERKVWAFLGDGEMDEPESLGAISLAAREELDNLVFVINCNLQRLDGPVRGNGKIIQELEGVFRGAGWNVIKVIWGEAWDPLLAKDKKGMLLRRMEEAVDGDYQNYKAKGGAYVREHFFGKYPETVAMVEDMTDDEIWALNRGGHCPHKMYAAYAKAMQTTGQPTVILAKTVKGYGLGAAGESINIAHSMKKPGRDALMAFRDRYRIPIADEDLDNPPFYKPEPNSAEMQYLHERREALGGYFPTRVPSTEPLPIPDFEIFENQTEGTGERQISTTMSFVRMLTALTRDKGLKERIVPIVPDEARTFGMEGLFRTLGIYAAKGQLYDPVDADQVMWYKEDSAGQILQEGITEAGAMSSWIAAATAYANHGTAMIPFYIYYSMFGFQRIGDLAWAAGDSQARGFLLGGTAGRTTLAGEGLQHQDGHSHVLASTIPNCRAYDPTFNYELAVIIHDGLERMYRDQENVFYYVTVMNENYEHPAMPDGVREGIVQGMYLFREGGDGDTRVQLLGSGAILREVIAAADLLKEDWNVESDVYSVTSFNELARDGADVERWNLLHPDDEARVPIITQHLSKQSCPVVAASDYIRAYADQVRAFVPHSYRVLGTDGYGRSDTRAALRDFFEVNRHYIAVAALKSLAEEGKVGSDQVSKAIDKYGIDPAKPNPMKV